MSSAPSYRALVLAAILLGSLAALLPVPLVAAQDDEDVPVPFAPVPGVESLTLHLWRTEIDIGPEGEDDDEPVPCNNVLGATPEPPEGAPPPPDASTCSLRTTEPDGQSPPRPNFETMTVARTEEGAPPELSQSATARFVLDTSPSTASNDAAVFPFSIKGGASSIQYQFFYDSAAVCVNSPLGAVGQILNFHVQFHRSTDGLASGAPFAESIVEACNVPAGPSPTDNQAIPVSGAVDLGADESFAAAEYLVMTIFATNADVPNLEWTLVFEHLLFDSRVLLRTDQAVEQAVWAADRGGRFKTTFDPNAIEEERFLVGRMALQSAFGASVVSTQFTGELLKPDGSLQDLGGGVTHVDMAEIDGLAEAGGARRVFQFDDIGGVQAWHYPSGVAAGAYTIRIRGAVLDEAVTLTRSVAMGAFDFALEPVEGEQVNHQLLRDSSTTFLLALTNGATVRDTYIVTAEFIFSSRNLVWTVAITGVDQTGRITLDPGSTGLLQVEMTPPSAAQSGDAARVTVTGQSLGSTAKKELNLEGQITTVTVRDVGILVLREGPQTIGIARENIVEAFVWNRGTAVDSFTVSIVDGSPAPNDPNKFAVNLAQTRFDNVDPGSVAPIPIRVTTTDKVVGGDTFSFKVRAQSVAKAEELAEATIETAVQAIRDFEVFGMTGRDTRVLRSIRWGRYNNSEDGTPGSNCETMFPFPPGTGDHESECGDYVHVAYHRFTVNNKGDQPETFSLTVVDLGVRGSGNCAPILEINEDETGIIGAINFGSVGNEPRIASLSADPGETKQFYYRVVWQSATVLQDADCPYDVHRATVKVIAAGVLPRTIDAETRVVGIVDLEDEDYPTDALALVALDERALTDPGELLISELPEHVGVTPGVEKAIPFVVSQQTGHEDRTRVTVGPSNVVDDLLDAGWTLEIATAPATVSIRQDGEEGNTLTLPLANVDEDKRGLFVPAAELFEPDVDDNSPAHASGVDYPLVLKVKPPTTGLQENERHGLTIFASSEFDPAVNHQLGIGVQIGEDFDFELVPGTETIEAHPGDVVAFGLVVKNTGATRDRYTVAAGAPASFAVPSVTPSVLEISPTSEKATTVSVNVPDGATPGTVSTISATVTSTGDPAITTDDIVKEVTFTIEVRPEGTLALAASPQVVTIQPGGEVAINFTLDNEVADDRNIRVEEIFAPVGWVTTLSGLGANDVRALPASASVPFTYLVEAPDDIVQGSRYTFVLRAEDVDDASDFANGVAFAVVAGTAAVSLEPEDTRVIVDRGASAVFDVLVRNIGAELSWFTISQEFQSAGWSGRVLDQDGNAIANATVRVPEKSFKRVGIEVTAPANVPKDHVENVLVRATGAGQASVSDQLALEAAIHDFDIGISIEGVATKDAAPGDDVVYLVSVTNRGNGPDRVRFTFEDAQGEDPVYPASTELSEDRTPELAAGETLSGVRVGVAVPSPNQGPVPVPEGIATVVRGTSSGQLPGGNAPTATTTVTTKLLPYVRHDVDEDGAFEMAVDANRNPADGFEVFADRDDSMIERGELARADSAGSVGLAVIMDPRAAHLVDTDEDGIAEVYYDPDRAQVAGIPYTVDANKDGEPDTPIDSDFDGLIDGIYDPATGEVHDAVNLDFSGDGRKDLLVDTNDDGVFDTFIDPNASPQIVTSAKKHGDRYELDTDGDGKVDTHYYPESNRIESATSSNLKDFLKTYWYFVVLFVIVIALFVAIVVRRL